MNKKTASPRGATKQAATPSLICGNSNSSTLQASGKRADPPAPQATWTRYADSRLKQFVCR
jgi:hypothetical protein